MDIIINTSSMIPFYLQIVDAIKIAIREGRLKNGDPLPSVRHLASELKISALTIKKAYDLLEEKGLVKTIHGKGSYIDIIDQATIDEDNRKEIEDDLLKVIRKAGLYHIGKEDLRELFEILIEEEK